MNPLGTRARVEELARLLDGAVSGPASLTAGHASLATRLRAIPPALDGAATIRPEFRTALRARLVAVATVQAAAAVDAPFAAPLARAKALDAAVSWTHSRKAQRRIGLTAGAMAGVIAFTGVGIAASRSLPGQPFYSLKRGAEDVQLQLTHDDKAQGTKHLEFAATRLREVKALADGDGELALGASGKPLASGTALGGSLQTKINDTLGDFNDETRSGQSLLESVYRKTGKPEPLRILKTFSSEQQGKLTALLPSLPAATQASAQQSLALVTEVNSTATQLLTLGTCGGECFPGNGGAALPTETPAPAPGATASSSSGADDNQVPPCSCGQPGFTPEPTPAGEPSPSAVPTSEPSASSDPTSGPTPTPTPSSSTSSGPIPGVTLPPVVQSLLPTIGPSLLPTTAPTLPKLPPVLPLLPLLPKP
jgi:hypothetical protein